MKKCPEYMDRKVFEFGTEDAGPGPAAYGARTTVGRLNRLPTVAGAPSCSMHQRLDLGNETEGPGPVVYNLAQLTCRGRAMAPRYSMAKKLPFDGDMDNPGPAAYKPRVPVNGPVPKMLFRIIDPDPRAVNPGSNVYKLPSTLSRKKITLAKKIDEIIDIKSPGPVYQTVPLNKYKTKAPQYSLSKKFENPLLANEMNGQSPSPQAYNPTLKYKYKVMPKFSFGMRRPDKFPPLVVCGDDVKIPK
ncbi:ciliary microtubule associated protein 1B-like [Metopolophium dirhodum]|uniref:ciliary microtubule associated protein 1B-like n=1 Tax=Metopolophium dirhodum TaxID=44670 RepID=UPI00298F96B3|nr:ciliary microtubule associated protein 1B-like [Metopolophium dirhodum]